MQLDLVSNETKHPNYERLVVFIGEKFLSYNLVRIVLKNPTVTQVIAQIQFVIILIGQRLLAEFHAVRIFLGIDY